jgi:multisubunit Na+/H+ antiporter MnhC subunit
MFSPDQTRPTARRFRTLTTLANARVHSSWEPNHALVVLILAQTVSRNDVMRKILAILLILGGIAALATPYITYTEKERVVDVGPIEIDAEKEKTIPIPQIAAVAAIIIGIGMLALGSRSEV